MLTLRTPETVCRAHRRRLFGSSSMLHPPKSLRRGKGSRLLRYNQLLFQHSNRRHEVVTPGPLVSGED